MSAKIRVFELAEKLGKNPQELRDELGKMGKPAHSNLSLVDAATAEAMLALAGGGKPAAAPVATKVKPAVSAAEAPAATPAAAEPEKSGVTIKFAIPKRKVKVAALASAAVKGTSSQACVCASATFLPSSTSRSFHVGNGREKWT